MGNSLDQWTLSTLIRRTKEKWRKIIPVLGWVYLEISKFPFTRIALCVVFLLGKIWQRAIQSDSRQKCTSRCYRYRGMYNVHVKLYTMYVEPLTKKNPSWHSLPVLSLSAGCQRNSPAEKAEITGWIFGRLWISKTQQALQPFFKPPKFNFQPAA